MKKAPRAEGPETEGKRAQPGPEDLQDLQGETSNWNWGRPASRAGGKSEDCVAGRWGWLIALAATQSLKRGSSG